jgi:hypothetical protein
MPPRYHHYLQNPASLRSKRCFCGKEPQTVSRTMFLALVGLAKKHLDKASS